MGSAARPLVVRPGPPLRGAFRAPGDKSVTHRGYLFALLVPGATEVLDPNPGEDCERTLAAVRALGVGVARDQHRVTFDHHRLSAPAEVIDCGNSGSTLRMLAGVLAAQPFRATLTGDASLRRRPVARIVEPLRRMGATLHAEDGDRLPPLVVEGGRLRGITYRLPVASAQVASAIELAATFAETPTTIEIPGAARDHTERMLRACGGHVTVEPLDGGGRRVHVEPGPPPGLRRFVVPGDPSAAAFFLAAAAAMPGAEVTARGLSLNPTRTGFLEVLEAMGARVAVATRGQASGDPVGDVTVAGPERLRAFDVPPEWLPRLVDEVPAWAILAAVADGTSRVSGAGELRLKESDRLAAIAAALRAVGIEAAETGDGLVVVGGRPAGGHVAAHGDHRIAMAFATLGAVAGGAVEVDDAGAIVTSFPGFAATLEALGGRVEHPEGERST